MHFDSFGIEYIPQEVVNEIGGKSITTNTFRMQDNGCTMCGFYYIAFIKHMLAGKNLLYLTIFFLQITIKRMAKKYKDKYDRRSKYWFKD